MPLDFMPDEEEALSRDAVRRMVAVLRVFPELESVFRRMDAFIADLNFVGLNSTSTGGGEGAATDGFGRIRPSLQHCMRTHWSKFVDDIEAAFVVRIPHPNASLDSTGSIVHRFRATPSLVLP